MVSKENALIYNNIDEALGNVIEKELKFVKLHLSCFVWGETDSELKNRETNLRISLEKWALYHIKKNLV